MMRFAALALLTFLSFAGAILAGGDTTELSGPPEIISGDSLIVAGTRVALQGIDAPELGQECLLRDNPYPCGALSRAGLMDLTAGVEVVCRLQDEAQEIAFCTADDYDLSEGMVYTGWALAARSGSQRYSELEEGARKAKRGLWRGRFVTPEDWRAGKRLADEP